MTQLTDTQPEPMHGDLIEIFGPGYQHWAIYLNDGYVIHVTSNDGSLASSSAISGTMSSGGSTIDVTVKKEKLTDVANGRRWVINNESYRLWNVHRLHFILQCAESRVGEKFPYHLLLNNCEHFVNQLCCGKPVSKQVRMSQQHIPAIEQLHFLLDSHISSTSQRVV
uniref:phospholipase A and acyltransferase 3-like n=1 Tax=Myxine glutinosa TaxID=7769 RepID=UPI00358E92B9